MANEKTPVMVLHELSVKRGWPTPVYNLTHSKQGTHENEFHYEVKAESVVGLGIGRSKQRAKHEAARSALQILEKLGMYSPNETITKVPRFDVSRTPIEVAINAIGHLYEVCAKNKIPTPTFSEISDLGPSHCKEFTYECHTASITTRATAGTKKRAKQLTAKEMLDRVTEVLPDLIAECNKFDSPDLATTESRTKGIALEELRKYIREEPTEENLKKFLDTFCSLININ